jgi:hypothetical protein
MLALTAVQPGVQRAKGLWRAPAAGSAGAPGCLFFAPAGKLVQFSFLWTLQTQSGSFSRRMGEGSLEGGGASRATFNMAAVHIPASSVGCFACLAPSPHTCHSDQPFTGTRHPPHLAPQATRCRGELLSGAQYKASVALKVGFVGEGAGVPASHQHVALADRPIRSTIRRPPPLPRCRQPCAACPIACAPGRGAAALVGLPLPVPAAGCAQFRMLAATLELLGCLKQPLANWAFPAYIDEHPRP